MARQIYVNLPVRDLERTRGFFANLRFGFNAEFSDDKAACMVCPSCDSQQQVDGLVAAAVKNGGTMPRPAQDHGFMYQHAFEDPDGHLWELVHMRNPQ